MAVAERSVDNVAVTRHPADVGRAPVDIFVAHVKGKLLGHGGIKQVTGCRMDDALGLVRSNPTYRG